MHNASEHTRSIWNNLRTKKVFLACSGGVDSMVLLHLLASLKVDLTVLHVNYQLRGEASDLDMKLVQSVCKEREVPFRLRTVDLKLQLQEGGNLQDKARAIRYDWFHEILNLDSNNRIALAQHEDDQVETFFLNIARKSGVLGLSCMKAELNGFVRPLLHFSKKEILKYAQVHAIKWREDESNKSNAYARNRLRNNYLPSLKTDLPSLTTSVSFLIEKFQHTQIELERTVKPIIQSINETGSLPISTFDQLSEWERVELLRQLGFSASYVTRFEELTEKGKQIVFHNSQFEKVVRDDQQFTFLKENATNCRLLSTEIDQLPSVFDKDTLYLDASKINGKLQLRKWQIGDRISPIGMNGSQLISDIIKDAKLTAIDKQEQLVLHDDESILWCVGLKISRKAVANSQSERIIRCSVIASKEEE